MSEAVVNLRGLGRYRELKRRWRAKRGPVFAVVMRASGNRCTMPDATLDASYQAYNGYRSGKPDKAFTPHPAIK
ncbi:Mannitol-1-phosphate 5-dehydrogenase [Escherichia coli]|uniref:Mannitol-1-phosphate 5-dehydrogenase n=2 Tax=Escherichia coli TaxID=562 RepID=A0A376TKU4_ECOLX|nr:Mannitol-1-phosphate 5-dehydrogenase [Escherichia coli]